MRANIDGSSLGALEGGYRGAVEFCPHALHECFRNFNKTWTVLFLLLSQQQGLIFSLCGAFPFHHISIAQLIKSSSISSRYISYTGSKIQRQLQRVTWKTDWNTDEIHANPQGTASVVPITTRWLQMDYARGLYPNMVTPLQHLSYFVFIDPLFLKISSRTLTAHSLCNSHWNVPTVFIR